MAGLVVKLCRFFFHVIISLNVFIPEKNKCGYKRDLITKREIIRVCEVSKILSVYTYDLWVYEVSLS